MKTWKNDNLLKSFKEMFEEEPKEYLEDLKKLIAGEFVASWQYEQAYKSIMGNSNLSYLQDHFSEHAGEEKDHYETLVDSLLERGETPFLGLVDSVQNALPPTEELTSNDCEYLKNFFIKSENNAVEAYTEFYDKIKDIDTELADIINGIISDEKGHSLDFQKLDGKVSAQNTVKEEPKVEEESNEKEDEKKDPITDNSSNKKELGESRRFNKRKIKENIILDDEGNIDFERSSITDQEKRDIIAYLRASREEADLLPDVPDRTIEEPYEEEEYIDIEPPKGLEFSSKYYPTEVTYNGRSLGTLYYNGVFSYYHELPEEVKNYLLEMGYILKALNYESRKSNNKKMKEKSWKRTVPPMLSKRFHSLIDSDDPDYEAIRQIIIEVLNFVKKSVSEDDWYEEDLLEDLEYCDMDDEDSVNYYINEMYNVLDGYDTWMEPYYNYGESNKKRVRESEGAIEQGTIVKIKPEWIGPHENPEELYVVMTKPEDRSMNRCDITAIRALKNPFPGRETVGYDMLIDTGHKLTERKIKESERPIKTWQDLFKPAELPNYCGIPGVEFVNHGEWTDPEIIYKGKMFNVHDIEDFFWDIYSEEHPEDSDGDNFGQYMLDHSDEVYEELNNLIEQGYGEDSNH